MPVSEYAPEPLVDTDGDGLPDQCETQVFKTDPNLIDTDNDGTDDGDEDHDGLGMTNLEEQAVAGKYDCVDVEDRGITEMAAAPLTESGGADVEPWVTAILEEKQAGQ